MIYLRPWSEKIHSDKHLQRRKKCARWFTNYGPPWDGTNMNLPSGRYRMRASLRLTIQGGVLRTIDHTCKECWLNQILVTAPEVRESCKVARISWEELPRYSAMVILPPTHHGNTESKARSSRHVERLKLLEVESTPYYRKECPKHLQGSFGTQDLSIARST